MAEPYRVRDAWLHHQEAVIESRHDILFDRGRRQTRRGLEQAQIDPAAQARHRIKQVSGGRRHGVGTL